MVKSLLVFILIFSNLTLAQNKSKFSLKDLKNLSSVEASRLYSAYIKFLVSIENEQITHKDFDLKEQKQVFNYFRKVLIKNAYSAGSLTGDMCFFGGYPSNIVNGYCTHPKNISSVGYDSSGCENGKFKCTPVFFGDNVCVRPESRYVNLTSTCLKESEDKDLEEIKENFIKSESDFELLQESVTNFCNANPHYDACEALDKSLKRVLASGAVSDLNSNIADGVDKAFSELEAVSIDRGCFTYNDIGNQCPKVLKESLKGMYWNGVVGGINYLDTKISNFFRDEENKLNDYRDPRSSCESSLPENLDSKIIEEQLKKIFPQNFQISDFKNTCLTDNEVKEHIEYGRDDKDIELAKSYMATDFNQKNENIKNAMIDLVDSNHLINNMIVTDKKIDCMALPYKEVAEKCASLQKCGQSKKKENFNIKKQEVKSALLAIKAIEDKINDRSSNRGSQKLSKADRTKLRAAVFEIESSNPLLKGKEFESIRKDFIEKGKFPNDSILNSKLEKQLKRSSEQINNKLSSLKKAHTCLVSNTTDCDKAYDEISALPSSMKTMNSGNKEYDDFNDFYQCVENQKKNRDTANDVLNDVALGTALSFLPGGVFMLAGRAAKAGSNLSKLASSRRAQNSAQGSMMLLGGGVVAKGDYEKCMKAEKEIKGYASKDVMSCEELNLSMYTSINYSVCNTQAIVAGLATIGGVGAGSIIQRVGKLFSRNKKAGETVDNNITPYIYKGSVERMPREPEVFFSPPFKNLLEGGKKPAQVGQGAPNNLLGPRPSGSASYARLPAPKNSVAAYVSSRDEALGEAKRTLLNSKENPALKVSKLEQLQKRAIRNENEIRRIEGKASLDKLSNNHWLNIFKPTNAPKTVEFRNKLLDRGIKGKDKNFSIILPGSSRRISVYSPKSLSKADLDFGKKIKLKYIREGEVVEREFPIDVLQSASVSARAQARLPRLIKSAGLKTDDISKFRVRDLRDIGVTEKEIASLKDTIAKIKEVRRGSLPNKEEKLANLKKIYQIKQKEILDRLTKLWSRE